MGSGNRADQPRLAFVDRGGIERNEQQVGAIGNRPEPEILAKPWSKQTTHRECERCFGGTAPRRIGDVHTLLDEFGPRPGQPDVRRAAGNTVHLARHLAWKTAAFNSTSG